jgi:predicted methyltransferase
MQNTSRGAWTKWGWIVWGSLVACQPQPEPTNPTSATSAAQTSAVSQAASAGSKPTVAGERSANDAWLREVVDAPDRSDEDRALDGGRKPFELLKFFGVSPGMHVAEISAGGGYTTELLARAVGAEGRVWGQNAPFFLQRFAEAPWSARLSKGVMARVTRIDTEFDAPFPPDVKGLDLVLDVLFYHDTVWHKTDRAAMNRAIFDALEPGGLYGIVDHSAAVGAGLTQVETLHRIEESVLRSEVEAAGFVLASSADFLRNPADTRDWSASPRFAGERRGQSDRFALRFQKPVTTP